MRIPPSHRILALAAGLMLVLGSSCESNPFGGELEMAAVAGTYTLTRVGAACDVMIAGAIREGGTFTAEHVEGEMSFDDEGNVYHHFSIAGACAFPDGETIEVDAPYASSGTYEVSGQQNVQMTHYGVRCTGQYEDGALTVRTGSLFPAVRFTYYLVKAS